jgi:FkbM family methyltransferase
MRNSSVSRLATLLLKTLISTPNRGIFNRVRWGALLVARRILVRFGDPVVEYKLHASALHMPLSHELPIFLRSYPLYSDNLGRIAAHLFAKYSDLAVIDIGANVGDSVIILHQHAPMPVLCVEGEPRFCEFLAKNVSKMLPAPVIEQSFVSMSGTGFASIVHDGTARLSRSQSGNGYELRTKSLEQILREHPSFQKAHLLKIDTDGMDVAILSSADDWLAQQKPVLFFEYDPDLQLPHGVEGLDLLRNLKRHGYHRVLVYENTGDYMFSAELANETLLSEMHEFFSGRHSARYCDLCIFHSEDEDIAESIRQSELDVFRAARQFPPSRESDR